MVEIKKRAISPEQKAFRRQQILDSTAEMFAARSYDGVNLAELAKAVGITKPALYRYFRSKEALFLALFEREVGRLLAAFRNAPKPDHIGPAIARLFVRFPLYCRLSAILHTVLERDLTYAEALAFKLNVKSGLQELGGIVAGWLGPDFEGNLEDLLMQAQQALIGVWHMTHPLGAMKEVLENEPELEGLCHDFEATLEAHLVSLFRR